MKKKKENGFVRFMKENGFVIALYSLVGVLLVGAFSITLLSIPKPNKDKFAENLSLLPTSNDLVESFKEKSKEEEGNLQSFNGKKYEKENIDEDPQDFKKLPKEEKPKVSQIEVEKKEQFKEEPKEKIKEQPKEELKKQSNIETEKEYIEKEDSYKEIENKEQKELEEQKEEMEKLEESKIPRINFAEVSDDVVIDFKENDTFGWPVYGNVVMDYSMDKLVYDKTLDQYRNNDSVAIGAPVNTPVLSVTNGIVEEVGTSIEDGNYVVVAHGNGFRTTYSQLAKDIFVTKSDVVKRGETLGYIENPTRHSVALGTHVDFKVTHNDSPINPHLYLEVID